MSDTQDQSGDQKPRPAHWFKPGQSGNPGGRPVGIRSKLQTDFLSALSEDFAAHGRDAIERCRNEKPDAYLKVIASLMPKEVEITNPADTLTDDQLAATIAFIDQQLAGRAGGVAEGASGPAVVQPTEGLSTLQ